MKECGYCGKKDLEDTVIRCPQCGGEFPLPTAQIPVVLPTPTPVPPAPAPTPTAVLTPTPVAPATVVPVVPQTQPTPTPAAPAAEPEFVEVMGHRFTRDQLDLILAAKDVDEAAEVVHDDFGTGWAAAVHVVERVRADYGKPKPAAAPARPLGQNVLTSLRGWLGKVHIDFAARWGAKVANRVKQVKARKVWEGYKSFSRNAANRRTPLLAFALTSGIFLAAILLLRVLIIPAFLAVGVGVLYFGRANEWTKREIFFGVSFFAASFVWLFFGKILVAVVVLLSNLVRCPITAEVAIVVVVAVALLVINRLKMRRVEVVASTLMAALVALFLVGLLVPAKIAPVVPTVPKPTEPVNWAKVGLVGIFLLSVVVAGLAVATAKKRKGLAFVVVALFLVIITVGEVGIYRALQGKATSTPKPTAQTTAANLSPTPNITSVYVEGFRAGAKAAGEACAATVTAVAQAAAGISTNTPAPTATPTGTEAPTATPTNTPTLTKKSEPSATPTKLSEKAAPTATTKPPEPTKPAQPPIKSLSRQVKLTGDVDSLRDKKTGEFFWSQIGIEAFDAKDRRIGEVVPLITLSQTVLLPEQTVQVKLWIGDLLGGPEWWKKYYVDHPRKVGSGDSPIVLTITSVFNRGRPG